MKKLYPLIFISVFPLIIQAQTSNTPDSLTELSVVELKDMKNLYRIIKKEIRIVS